MKKITTSLTILASVILVILSCQKKTNNTPPSSNQTTSTTGSTTGSTTSGSGIGGMFSVVNLFSDAYSTGSKDSSGTATAQPTNSSYIGAITMNNDSLGYFMGAYSTSFVSFTPLPLFTGNLTWKVTGGAGYGAFTYTVSKPMPTVGNLHLAITSISHSSNLVINHAAITADTVLYQISDDIGNKVTKKVPGSSGGCTFTAAMLSTLNVGSTDAVIQILGSNYVFSTQGGKNILFNIQSEYSRDGITIN